MSENQKDFKEKYGINKYILKGIQRKIELVEMLGGKCQMCGYNKNIAALDFHHINPYEKSFEIKIQKLNYMNKDIIIAEAKKCMLLCSNCHREFHSPQMNYDHLTDVLKVEGFEKQF